jgi:hypothetical protein
MNFERYAGSLAGGSLVQMSLTMSDCTQLKTWVSRETKTRFASVALHQGLSDSATLKRLVEMMLQASGVCRRRNAAR